MLSGLFRACQCSQLTPLQLQITAHKRAKAAEASSWNKQRSWSVISPDHCSVQKALLLQARRAECCSGLANQQPHKKKKKPKLTACIITRGKHLTRAIRSQLEAFLASVPDYHHLSGKQVPNIKEQHSHEITQSILLHGQAVSCRHGDHSRAGAIWPQIRAIWLRLPL